MTQPHPLLGVVVIARDEAERIAGCLESVLALRSPFPDIRVVVVDSGSRDDTVAVTCRYPVEVYRYTSERPTAAAGRRIGFDRMRTRYVLFVDGDCRIDADWVVAALRSLEASPDSAVAWGDREEVFEDLPAGARSRGPEAGDYGLGGNALYRADLLRQAGGFNPHVVADEEAELLARIERSGYRALRIPGRMIVHYTVPKSSLREFARRLRRGMFRGNGQVLRLSIGQGLFGYHLRRLNRYVMMLVYLVGAILIGAGVVAGLPALPATWCALGVAGFAALALKRRSLGSAVYIVADWLFVAVGMIGGFLERPRRPEAFDPLVERVKPGAPESDPPVPTG